MVIGGVRWQVADTDVPGTAVPPAPWSRRWSALALVLSGVLVGGGVAAAASPIRQTAFDKQMISLVNKARAAYGLQPVREAKGLDSLSVWWSTRLATGGTGYVLQHNPNAWTMLPDYGAANRTSWGENVAKFSPSSVPAQEIFNAYMHSPGHRANILGASYRYIGMGTMAGAHGTFNTMTFTDNVQAGQVVTPAKVRGKLVVRDTANKAVAGVRYSVRRGSCVAAAQVVQKTTASSGAFGMDLVPGPYCAIPTAWPHSILKPPRRDWVVRVGTPFAITARVTSR